MLTVESTHFPSPDDISFESLEYLFSPSGEKAETPIPWVQMESELPAFAKDEILKLQTELTIVERALRESTANMQRACILIGYLQACVQQKDEQLKVIPDLRFRAAESIAYKVDAERCRTKIGELEETVARLNQGPKMNFDGLVQLLFTPVPAENLTSTMLFCFGAAALSVVAFCWLRGI